MTEFYIVREYNGGTQFKPQKVYALKNYFTQWFYTYEDCMEECELRAANVIRETTTDIDILKKKVRLLEDKKQRLIAAGLHPESRNLYETLPRIGWRDVTYDASLSIFLGNIYQQKIKCLGVQPKRILGIGFEYVIDVPADTAEVIVEWGGCHYTPAIEGDRVKRIRFKQPGNSGQHFTIYAKLSHSALYRKQVSEISNKRLDASRFFRNTNSKDFIENPVLVDHRLDALRYAFGGHQVGKIALRDMFTISNVEAAKEALARFRNSFPLPKFPTVIETKTAKEKEEEIFKFAEEKGFVTVEKGTRIINLGKIYAFFNKRS